VFGRRGATPIPQKLSANNGIKCSAAARPPIAEERLLFVERRVTQDNLVATTPAKAESRYSSNSIAFCKLVARISLNLAFDVFPHVTQIIFSGAPSLFCNSGKSLSFVITAASASRAEKKMTWSSASRKPRSRTAIASMLAKFSEIHFASAGDSCASIQSFIYAVTAKTG